jgi:hypothetical protein
VFTTPVAATTLVVKNTLELRTRLNDIFMFLFV